MSAVMVLSSAIRIDLMDSVLIFIFIYYTLIEINERRTRNGLFCNINIFRWYFCNFKYIKSFEFERKVVWLTEVKP